MNDKIINALKDINIPVSFQVYIGNESTYITFFEYNGQNEEYSEDEVEIEGFYYQIDLWSKSDYTKLVKTIKEKLKKAGFKFIDDSDLFEKDTKIYHKGLRYYMPNYKV